MLYGKIIFLSMTINFNILIKYRELLVGYCFFEKVKTMTANLDIVTLARTLYGEARGEDRQSKIAVACVVLNRVEKKKQCGWRLIDGKKVPTIAATCLKPYQFSCWNEKDPNRKIIIAVTSEDKVFAECLDIAKLACSGKLKDETKGATHYYNPKACIKPRWAEGKTPCAVVGKHLFFNNVD